MTSQDIKKQLKEPHFWNIVLTGQHAEPRTKAMLEAKGIITWLPLAPVRLWHGIHAYWRCCSFVPAGARCMVLWRSFYHHRLSAYHTD